MKNIIIRNLLISMNIIFIKKLNKVNKRKKKKDKIMIIFKQKIRLYNMIKF